MSLAVRGQPVRHFKARARQVFDVSGAGDTALAAIGAALASGAPIEQAIELAILASGIVVGKVGAAAVSPAELIDAEVAQHFIAHESKIAPLDAVLACVAHWRGSGLRIGFTNGCFDILHRGHVAYLVEARKACDRLIVAVNTDASVRALKGDGRPVNDLEGRALVLAGLASIDLVTPFEADTPIALIEAIRPDVLAKGADYTVETVVGADFVQSYGGEVKLIPLVEGYSTTAAIEKLAAKAEGGA
jgi:D-beta-D-heptose 7-phosphate kinase/D-beta-D-heptose 1-phosphate adenosyltransferase